MTPGMIDPRNGDVDEIPDTGPGTPTTKQASAKQEARSLADRAHDELAELLERCNLHNEQFRKDGSQQQQAQHQPPPAYREAFPVACLELLHSLPGNKNCIDCNVRNPEWAIVSYGALVCIKCSGRHRSMGVAISQVRSVSMDHWTHKEVVQMLEGGNDQLKGFFARHALTEAEFKKQEKQQQRKQQHRENNNDASATPRPKKTSLTSENVATLRYKTKAALFYKNQLEAHVERLLEDPSRRPYRGRSRP